MSDKKSDDDDEERCLNSTIAATPDIDPRKEDEDEDD